LILLSQIFVLQRDGTIKCAAGFFQNERPIFSIIRKFFACRHQAHDLQRRIARWPLSTKRSAAPIASSENQAMHGVLVGALGLVTVAASRSTQGNDLVASGTAPAARAVCRLDLGRDDAADARLPIGWRGSTRPSGPACRCRRVQSRRPLNSVVRAGPNPVQAAVQVQRSGAAPALCRRGLRSANVARWQSRQNLARREAAIRKRPRP